jgi:hypothetical protein
MTVDNITTVICSIRGHRVILDSDLVCLNGMPMKRLNGQYY